MAVPAVVKGTKSTPIRRLEILAGLAALGKPSPLKRAEKLPAQEGRHERPKSRPGRDRHIKLESSRRRVKKRKAAKARRRGTK